MKFVALLSGGKDSCYNIVHCIRNGHELVAAASLRPPEGKGEIDSYMYQTVGQDAIEMVAQALDVPLFRQVIEGQAIELSNDYGSRTNASISVQNDETEDLYQLLSTVKASHRDVEGVSVGAILSTYQRVRVEHVCRRLGLTALCYLWQRDQRELLAEMIADGVEAILIKVAGIGLTPQHLGKSLAQMEPLLHRLNEQYGAHICGEGGEYESLTLDCSAFKSRIVVNQTKTVIHSDNSFATVAYLEFAQLSLEPKDDASSLSSSSVNKFLDEDSVQIAEDMESTLVPNEASSSSVKSTLSHLENPTTHQRRGRWLSISNLGGEVSDSLDAEVTSCFKTLQDVLTLHGLDFTNLVHMDAYLASMNDFASMNAIYSQMFGINPPARACVSVHLDTRRFKLSCLAFDDKDITPNPRQALHVQGISYWAPANIGPYSQAIQIDSRVLISGQIGLIPARMTLPDPPSLAQETALSLQHINRISNALSGVSNTWAGHDLALIAWVANPHAIPSVMEGVKAAGKTKSPFIAVTPLALPKAAQVEMQIVLHTGQLPPYKVQQTEEDLYEEPSLGLSYNHTSWDIDENINVQLGGFEGVEDACIIISLSRSGLGSLEKVIENDSRLRNISTALWTRLFSVANGDVSEVLSNLPELLHPSITTISVTAIQTMDGRQWDYALLILCV